MSNKSKKAISTKEKEITPTLYGKLSYYFCCLCLIPKRYRKLNRQLERELALANKVDDESDEELDEEEATQPVVSIKTSSAIKIQSVMRMFLARILVKEAWESAIEEANRFWLVKIRAMEAQWMMKEQEIEARKQVMYCFHRNEIQCSRALILNINHLIICDFQLSQFVHRYVKDVLDTSLMFMSQTSEASTEIQR